MKLNVAAFTSALMLAAIGMTGCAGEQPVQDIASFTFAQSKSVPDYDNSTYTVTDESQIAKLESLLEQHNWNPGWTDGVDAGCTGGTSTTIDITFVDKSTARIDSYQCQSKDPFVVDLTQLVQSWH